MEISTIISQMYLKFIHDTWEQNSPGLIKWSKNMIDCKIKCVSSSDTKIMQRAGLWGMVIS
jgi:hypothetical protein